MMGLALAPALVWAGLGVVFLNLGLVIYRLYLHPLAKFPGPKIAATTFWWEFFQEIFAKQGGDYVNQVERMHDIYGPIVRVTPDEVHIRDPEWSHVLYAGAGHIRDKDSSLAHAAGTADGSFGSVKHEIHRHRRAPVSSYFSKASVYEMQNKIWERAQFMCSVLKGHYNAGTVVNGRAMFLGWSNDTLRRCSFGKHKDLIEDPKRALQFDRVFKAFATFYPILKQCEWIIPLALKMPTAPFWWIYQPLAILLTVHVEMISMADTAIQEHDKKYPNGAKPTAQDNSRNLYHALLSSSLPPEEKEAKRMAHEGFEILLAGSDTTARTMGIAFYHVMANPYVGKRLKTELETVMINPHGQVDLRKLEALPWLSAIINEALRIGKVTDHRLSLVPRYENLQFREWLIPAGSRVSMTPTRNSYDEKYFPNPAVFMPERWLQDEATLAAMNYVFMPFAHGRRGCLGLHFAHAELRVGLASVFRQFDFDLFETIRERDIDATWAHIAGEPDKNGKGLRFKVVKAV